MKDYMAEWKRNSIRIGAPTCIMAAFTAFIPVLTQADLNSSRAVLLGSP